MSRYKKLFSYYGSKSKLAARYPAPTQHTVIEPFAGSGAYSLLHHEHDVILNEKDELTASVWAFVTSKDALDDIENYLPRVVAIGQRIDDLVDASKIPVGLLHLIRSEISQGCFGERGYRTIVTKWGARDWHGVMPRLQFWIPKIKHWRVLSGDYSSLNDITATWFIDPPYANAAGSAYRTNDVDYVQLGAWCQSRPGQVIVCENEGATWLPFEHFNRRAGCFTGRDSKAKAGGAEVIWLNDKAVTAKTIPDVTPPDAAQPNLFPLTN